MKKILRLGWILPLVILAAIAGVVVYAWSQQRAADAMAHVPRPRPQHAVSHGPIPKRGTGELFLAAPQQLSPTEGRVIPSLLVRELVRQSILLAGREGLGLTIRDGVLRESASPAAASAAYVRLDENYLRDHSIAYSLYGSSDATDSSFSDDFPIPGQSPDAPDLLPMLVDAEARSRGQYVDLLKQMGFSAAARTTASTQPAVPPDVEAKLAVLTEVAQFAAVREAHAALKRSGDSPAWLGVLVRGYANLGQLTYGDWNTAHDVFVARSLLYAQRMVAADPKSASAHWHRAYAFALAGLHKHALEDLAAATQGQGQAPPGWVELLDPLCRYRTEKLVELAGADKSRAPLAMFLCYLTVEHCGSTSAVLETAKAALQVNPQCMRLIDGMCRHAGVSYLHGLTQMGPEVFRSTLGPSLSRLSNLPASLDKPIKTVTANWQDPAVVADACQAFVDAPDTQEFSWTLLGRLLQETNFVHVEMETEFLAIYLGVAPGPFVQSAAPLVKDHPFKPYVDALACYSGGNPDMDRIRDIIGNFNIPDVRRPMLPAIQLTLRTNTPGIMQGSLAWNSLQGSTDNTAWDQEERCSMDSVQQWQSRPKAYPRIAERLAAVSPYAPNAIAVQIVFNWTEAQNHVDQWQQQYPGHPAVNGALAWQYTQLKQYDKAEQFFRAYLKNAPDPWAYRMLGNNYRLQGDEKKWLETIDESLKQEDYGLDHSITQAETAGVLMDEGRFKEALPYAEAAAGSGSGMGLTTAARCHEGLGDWEQAEALTKECAERYARPMDYFWWCARTGHGDRQSASRAAGAWIESFGYSKDSTQMIYRLSFYLVDNQPANAADAAKRLMDATGEPWAGIHLALIDLKNGDAAGMDAALAEVERRGPDYKVPYTGRPRPEMIQVASLLRKCLAGGKSAELDLAAVDHAMEDTNPEEQANISYFVGRFLELRANVVAAEKYYARAARGPTNDTNVLLAIEAVRNHSPATAPSSVGP